MNDNERFIELEKRIKELEGKISESEKSQKVKKPRQATVYALFVKDVMPSLREEFPGLKQSEYMKKCGEMWKLKKSKET